MSEWEWMMSILKSSVDSFGDYWRLFEGPDNGGGDESSMLYVGSK